MKPTIIADEVPNAETILAQISRPSTLKTETVFMGNWPDTVTRIHRKPTLVLPDELDKSEGRRCTRCI